MMLGQQYKIISELGAGGMGIVYQAVDVMLEREVAIKKLRNEFSSTPDIAERFRREAKTQARLNHPNIAHLYSFFKDGDAFYIVMEFVGGAPLSSLLPMNWERAIAAFFHILDGLEYAHSLGVLHRDLKPDNIMVSPRGEIKVMDFGIAHVLGQTRQTREKSIVGTLEYVPPELILGKSIDRRSDIYSLGVLLFEMISGHVPFESKVEFELLRHHLETVAPRLSSVVGGVPEFIDDAIAKCLSKDPNARFASCAEFAAELKLHAPELAAANVSQRQFQSAEVDRCVRRIGALLDAGEAEVAALVVENALADYAQDSRLLRCQARVREAKVKRESSAARDERAAFVRDILTRLAQMETQGDMAGFETLAQSAAARYPNVLAFQIALAHLQRRQA